MKLTGHKTLSMFTRYNTVDQADAKEAMRRLDRYFGGINEPTAAIVLQGQKRGQDQSPNPLNLLAPRAGLGHSGRTFCFSLRNLPFGFLMQRIRGAFPPTWSAESSLRVLQWRKLANKKGPCFWHGPFVFWLPFVNSYRTLCIAPTPTLKAVFNGIRQLSL
jgi:hypothetical protein